jgi:hypothetical protein
MDGQIGGDEIEGEDDEEQYPEVIMEPLNLLLQVCFHTRYSSEMVNNPVTFFLLNFKDSSEKVYSIFHLLQEL